MWEWRELLGLDRKAKQEIAILQLYAIADKIIRRPKTHAYSLDEGDIARVKVEFVSASPTVETFLNEGQRRLWEGFRTTLNAEPNTAHNVRKGDPRKAACEGIRQMLASILVTNFKYSGADPKQIEYHIQQTHQVPPEAVPIGGSIIDLFLVDGGYRAAPSEGRIKVEYTGNELPPGGGEAGRGKRLYRSGRSIGPGQGRLPPGSGENER